MESNPEELVKDVTVVALKEMCRLVSTKRKLKDEAQDVADKLSSECKDLEHKLTDLMAKLEIKSFVEGDEKFIQVDRTSITIPKGEERDQFFTYLKEMGHFDSLITVNSATLNSWWKQENEKAKSRGEPYVIIPGLAMPTTTQILSVRKA